MFFLAENVGLCWCYGRSLASIDQPPHRAISHRVGLKSRSPGLPVLPLRVFGTVGDFGHGAIEYFSIQRKSARRLKPSLRAVSLLFP